MDLQAEKLELMKLLLETESAEVIKDIKAVFKKRGNDFYDDLPQHVKESIEIAIKQVEDGEVYDHDWVMRDIKSKYGLTN